MMTPGVAVGSEGLYETLYSDNHARILRLCRLLVGNDQLAEEAAQDAFLKLHVALRAGKEHPDWQRWLTRVAVNGCKDMRRGSWWKNWLRGDEGFDESAYADRGDDPERMVLGRRERLRIHGALDRLTDRQRRVFILRHLEGWSTEEVGELLGVDAGTVKQHLFRAVERLRRALGSSR